MLTEGISLSVAIKGANRHDMKLVQCTLEGIMIKRPTPAQDQPQCVCFDNCYDFDEVRDIVKEFGFTAHIHARGEGAQAIKKEAASRPCVGWWSTRTA